MKKAIASGARLVALGAAIMAFQPAAQAGAELLNFDTLTDASDGFGGSAIPNGYGFLNWNNFNVDNGLETLSAFGSSGFNTGIVSSPNVATGGLIFDANGNITGDLASFSSAGKFELVSFNLTAAFNLGLQVTVTGLNGSTVVDTTTLSVGDAGPTLETFDWTGLTEVDISSTGGTQDPNIDPDATGSGPAFVIDDLAVVVPEPASFAIFGMGLAGLAILRRRRLS